MLAFTSTPLLSWGFETNLWADPAADFNAGELTGENAWAGGPFTTGENAFILGDNIEPVLSKSSPDARAGESMVCFSALLDHIRSIP